MAVIGTFGSFTAARLGIYASQSSLNVTGNNIANINTKGYTRQRADLVSLYSDGNIRYANGFNLNIGYGVLVDGISQLRDPFLDIRYRNENSGLGANEAKLDCLNQLAHILDEVGKGNNEFGIMEDQFNDLLTQLETFNSKANVDVYDTAVRGSAESLTKLFRDYAAGLQTVQDNKLGELKENVKSVNTLLTQIRDLSAEIREAGIHGDQALELRDQRNVCIDELSTYMKIDVRYDMEKIDEFNSVERLNISIADSGTPPIKLVQGIYATQLNLPDMAAQRNPKFNPSDPTCNRYISQESTPGNIKYTNSEREALKNKDGVAITNDNAGEALIKAMDGFDTGISDANKYDPAKGPYLMADGTATDDPEKAAQVANALEGHDENRLWISLEPLKDAKDRYMRDQYGKEIKESVDLSDNQLYGSLQAIREFLTEKGEFSTEDDRLFDPEATQKRGVQYYKRSLDALAKKFADAFNRANTKDSDPPTYDKVFLGYETKIENGVKVYDLYSSCNLVSGQNDAEPVVKALEAKGFSKDYLKRVDLSDLPDDLQKQVRDLQEKHLPQPGHGKEVWGGGVLFSNSGDNDDPENITAANISISASWSTGDVRILNTKKPDALDHSTADDNILHMINLMSAQFDYLPNEVVNNAVDGNKKYFTGSFQERLAEMNSTLAIEGRTTATLYNNFSTQTLTLENSRQSVSGVDLNDEATNMMVFQKSYAAACQLMTTLDSMLDKLINGTIR